MRDAGHAAHRLEHALEMRRAPMRRLDGAALCIQPDDEDGIAIEAEVEA